MNFKKKKILHINFLLQAIAILFIVAACQAHPNYYVHHWDARQGSYGYSSSGGKYYRYRENSGLPSFVHSKYRNNIPSARRIDSRIVEVTQEVANKFTHDSCEYSIFTLQK